MDIARDWKDYEIIDMANGEKLERWGNVTLIRPDPQIIWKEKTFPEKWSKANARYNRSSSGGGGWKYNKNSKLEKIYIQAYKKYHNGNDPIVCAIHAGVECGMIYEKLPHLDMISLGPDVKDVHTVNEKLYLLSCKTLLNTLLEIINNLD